MNYGNWLNWAYNATIGFPLQFGSYYTKEFADNLMRKKREKLLEDNLVPQRNIFYESLYSSWRGIRRTWRNLAIRTYAAPMIRRWHREYDNDSKL